MSSRYRYFHLPDQVYQRNVKVRMVYCNPVSTPMQTSCKLSKDYVYKDAYQRLYKSMIGILLYVTASRPDVMQAVGQVEIF
jgi:hypothetical protein